jgi:hypothetical protein
VRRLLSILAGSPPVETLRTGYPPDCRVIMYPIRRSGGVTVGDVGPDVIRTAAAGTQTLRLVTGTPTATIAPAA